MDEFGNYIFPTDVPDKTVYTATTTVGDFMSEDGGIYIIRNGFLIKVGQAKMESSICSH